MNKINIKKLDKGVFDVVNLHELARMCYKMQFQCITTAVHD